MTDSTRGYAPPHRGDRGRASRYSASTGSHGFGTSALHNLAGFLSTVSAGDRGISAVSAQPSQHSGPSCQRQTRSLGFFDAQTTREGSQNDIWGPSQFKIRGFNDARSRRIPSWEASMTAG